MRNVDCWNHTPTSNAIQTFDVFWYLFCNLLTSINKRFDTLYKEIKLIRLRLEALEEILSEEELGEDDKRALREALEEHRRGETVSLEEALRRTE